MKNIFTMAGQSVGPGYAVVMHYRLGLYGAFNVYCFSSLKISGKNSRKLEFSAQQAFAWDGAFESTILPANIRAEEPMMRSDLQTYIPRRFAELDVLQVPPDGRFFFSHTERTTPSGVISASVDYDQGGEAVYVCSQEEMLAYLWGQLFYMGVPRASESAVQDHLIARFHDFELDL